MDAKTALLDAIKKNVNVPGFISDSIDGIVEPALKAAIEQTATKLDDMAFAALWPILETEMKKFIIAKWAELLTAPPTPGDLVLNVGEGPIL